MDRITNPLSRPFSMLLSWMAGIELFSASVMNPPLQFWAIQVALQAPFLSVQIGPETIQHGRGKSLKPTTFARMHNCQVAINANPFIGIRITSSGPNISMYF